MKVNPVLLAEPPKVVTLTLPEVPFATTAEMLVEETTVKEIGADPPKVTEVAPVNPVPEITTVCWVVADAGVKELITGDGRKVNPEREAVPPGVVTLMLPDAPAATTAVILVVETTLNEVAGVPPKLTAVAPPRSVPVMVTVAPAAAVNGAKEVITGGTSVVTSMTLLSSLEPPAFTAFNLYL